MPDIVIYKSTEEDAINLHTKSEREAAYDALQHIPQSISRTFFEIEQFNNNEPEAVSKIISTISSVFINQIIDYIHITLSDSNTPDNKKGLFITINKAIIATKDTILVRIPAGSTINIDKISTNGHRICDRTIPYNDSDVMIMNNTEQADNRKAFLLSGRYGLMQLYSRRFTPNDPIDTMNFTTTIDLTNKAVDNKVILASIKYLLQQLLVYRDIYQQSYELILYASIAQERRINDIIPDYSIAFNQMNERPDDPFDYRLALFDAQSKYIQYKLANNKIEYEASQKQRQNQIEMTIRYFDHLKRQAIAYSLFGNDNYVALNKSQKQTIEIKLKQLKNMVKPDKWIVEFINNVNEYNLIGVKRGLAELRKRLSIDMSVKNIINYNALIEFNNDKGEQVYICPHIVYKAIVISQIHTKKTKDNNIQALRIGPIINQLIALFSISENLIDVYYCKICGETIAMVDTTAKPDTIRYEEMSDIRTKIWKEAAYIFNYVTYKINPKVLITNIVDTISNRISILQTSISKIKTNTQEQTKRTISIFICIYVYAFLIHNISINPDAMQLKTIGGSTKLTTGAKEPAKTKTVNSKQLQLLFKISLSNIMHLQQANMVAVGFDGKSIKKMLINTYRYVAQLRKTQYTENTQANELATLFSLDSTYNYLYWMHKMNNINKPPLISDTKLVIGQTIADILNKTNKLYTKAPVAIRFKGQSEASYKSYLFLIAYYTEQVHLLDPYGDAIKSFMKQYEVDTVRPQYIYPEQSISNNIANIREYNKYCITREHELSHLARFYCPDGHRHSMTINIYRVNGKNIERSNTAIEHNWKYIDNKCSKCGFIQLGSIAKQLNEKIYEQLNILNKKIGFYNYFDIYCPAARGKSKFHIYDNKANDITCIQCGYKQEQTQTYYNKWKNAYSAVKKERKEDLIKKMTAVDAINNNKTSKPVYADKPLSESQLHTNMQMISKAIKQIGMDYNSVMNIGLSENFKYTDILKHVINPREVTIPNTMDRVYKIRAYIIWIIRTYHMIKNSIQMQIPIEQEKLAFVSKVVYPSELSKFMDTIDIYDDFHTKYERYLLELSIDSLVIFLITCLGNIFIKLHKAFNSSSGHKFIKFYQSLQSYWVAEIRHAELMISIPPPATIAIEKDIKSEDTLNKELAGEFGQVYIEADDIEQDPEIMGMFSVRHVDIEQDEFGEDENIY